MRSFLSSARIIAVDDIEEREITIDNDNNNHRLGLGLSGGGFRASFYHSSVLAKMAELGMLRHVESISTISGGSIGRSGLSTGGRISIDWYFVEKKGKPDE